MTPMRIVIVGGVAGGASAAAKARRTSESADIQLFERGKHISFANCGLPYFIGGEITDRQKLLISNPEVFAQRYRVQVHLQHEVLAIDRAQRKIQVRNQQGELLEVPYDRLILSQGAEAIVPALAGVELAHVFTLRSLSDMDTIVTALEQKSVRKAVVVGGGYIGLEMAEAFYRRGLEVSVVEMAPHILPRMSDDLAAELESQLQRERFELHTGRRVESIGPENVLLDNGTRLEADLVLLSAGIRPENQLAREAGLEIGPTGGLRTNGTLQTSDPLIYAVGDMAEVRHRITGAAQRLALAGPASRQGRIAGANAAGAHLNYGGVLGTSIVRVLEQTIGFVGLNIQDAAAAGLRFKVSTTRDNQHAGYYPGASTLVTQLLVEDGSGRILGAQIMGKEGVDKRIDVLATAIYGHLSVFDLEELDLAYAPPFGATQDPLNVAGFVAARELRGELAVLDPREALPKDLLAREAVLLDVRDPQEITQHGSLPGARNIPLNALRSRLQELPRQQPLIVYCQKGLRGYLAARILMQSGFDEVWQLKGGYLQARWNGLDEQLTPSS